MKESSITILLFVLMLLAHECLSQTNVTENDYKVMFYNVENLFDTENDSLINDEEFLPNGDRFWTNTKYYNKLRNIYKVVMAIGGWNPPAIIGLCEIENHKVLNDLVNNTPLVKFEYQIIHKNSPDRRGIDVGFLYRKDLFEPVSHNSISINYPDQPENKTRDILYVKGIANQVDTIHVFVNHWPSRWGGQFESEDRRIFVAGVLKTNTDSIFARDSLAKIIIMGDFNDYPMNTSLNKTLQAKTDYSLKGNSELYNLSASFQKKNIGTNKYEGEWGILDQIIVSGSLLNSNESIYTSLNDVYIFNSDFLLEPDEGYFGFKPKRTFAGFTYIGGFSDHLPTYLVLNFKEN